MQETGNIFRTGKYHRSFERKHTRLMHLTRRLRLQMFYATGARLLKRLGWPDPLTKAAPQVLLCGTASPYTTSAFVRFVSKYSTTAGIDVLDISPYALSQSAQFLKTCQDLDDTRVSFVEGDALCLPFADERFDWIETDFFIQFFSTQEKVTIFQEWYRVLKPGGVITTRDWLPERRGFAERIVERTKDWLIRHILGPVTYHANAEDVREALGKISFASAMFPVSIPGIRLKIPGMQYLLIHKPASAGAGASSR